MKGLDTNILVRYITRDDEAQHQMSVAYISRNCSEDSPAFINRIVLCELVWVLEAVYGYKKVQIASVIEKILQTSQFIVENSDEAWQALMIYQTTQVDFSDAMIGFCNQASGCSKTATFDKKAGALAEFELLAQ